MADGVKGGLQINESDIQMVIFTEFTNLCQQTNGRDVVRCGVVGNKASLLGTVTTSDCWKGTTKQDPAEGLARDGK